MTEFTRNPIEIAPLLDANIDVADKLGLRIEFISMPSRYAEYLSEEVLRTMMTDEYPIAVFPTIKEYRNIPIRVVDNLTVKVCYALE